MCVYGNDRVKQSCSFHWPICERSPSPQSRVYSTSLALHCHFCPPWFCSSCYLCLLWGFFCLCLYSFSLVFWTNYSLQSLESWICRQSRVSLLLAVLTAFLELRLNLSLTLTSRAWAVLLLADCSRHYSTVALIGAVGALHRRCRRQTDPSSTKTTRLGLARSRAPAPNQTRHCPAFLELDESRAARAHSQHCHAKSSPSHGRVSLLFVGDVC